MELIDARRAAVRAMENLRTNFATKGPDHRFYDGRTVGGILAAFDALGADPTPEGVADAAGWGRDSLTQACHECNQDVPAVVQLGELPDHESKTANICRACLVKALVLFDQRSGVA